MAALAKRIDRLPMPEQTLLEVSLKGLLFSDHQGEYRQLRDRVEARFFFSRFISQNLRPAPQDENWIQDLPAGILQDAARRLQELSQKETGDGSQNRIAGLALQELYELVAEAHS
jgi:hypothetical protein